MEHEDNFIDIPARVFVGPIVYKVIYNDQVVYVGMSEKGLARPFDSSHKCSGVLRLLGATLSICPVLDKIEARCLEANLIKKYKPLLNIRLNERGYDFFNRSNPNPEELLLRNEFSEEED